MKERDRRNLNPRPPAVFAMYHWPADYAAQRGGSMDFFDQLHPGDQKFCSDAVTAIVASCLAYGVALRVGDEPVQKPAPRLKRTAKKRKRR